MIHNDSLRMTAGLLALAASLTSTRVLAAPPTTVDVPPSSAPPPPPSPEPVAHLPAYIAGGLAVLAAGAGVAFGVVALDAKSDFEKSPTQSRADTGNDFAAYCDASFGAAVLAGATGLVLFLTERDAAAAQASPPQEAAVTFTASPIVFLHGAGAGATLQF